MDKNNKKIQEAKKIIKEEKKKIKQERKNIKKKKLNNFKKTRLGRFLGKFIYVFSDEKSSYSFSEVFVITIISLVLGVFACFSVMMIATKGRNLISLSKDLGKFYDVYETLIDNYNGDIDKEKIIDDAINGMVSNVGDVYTNYADTSTTDKFNEMVNGVYEGIGCTIQQLEDAVKIVDIYEGSPADKAGLKVDDYIKTVDSKDALELGVAKISEYVKNEAKGNIEMVVLRGDEEIKVTLKRDKVEIPAVSARTFEKNGQKRGYLKISIFSSVSSKQFDSKIKELEKDGINSLIIDVRGNNGGYLTAVTDIASMLLPRGKNIYQIQKDNNKKATKDKTFEKREYPIAILVNGESASASEILAGAIKESYNGYVVGTKTYGKGTVQQVKQLSDGSMIKYTVENWLTPDGNWINDVGIEPTDKVELNEKYYENPTDETDNQLQKALELVSG